MRKFIAGAVIAAFGLAGAVTPAFAADAATVVLTGGSKAVINTMPDSLVATTNSAGTVEYQADGKTIAGCEKVATSTVTPFKQHVLGFQLLLRQQISQRSLPLLIQQLQLLPQLSL